MAVTTASLRFASRRADLLIPRPSLLPSHPRPPSPRGWGVAPGVALSCSWLCCVRCRHKFAPDVSWVTVRPPKPAWPSPRLDG